MSDDLRARYERFRATELGQLFTAYDHATIAYWRLDASETVSDKRLRELDEAARAATNAFVAKLMQMARVDEARANQDRRKRERCYPR